jgi:hypothetical protein
MGMGFGLVVASIPALVTFALYWGLMFSGSPMIQMTSAAVIASIAIRETVRLVNRWGDARPEKPPAIVRRIVRWAIRRNNPDYMVSPGQTQDHPRD